MPQILKKAIKDRILESALESFLEKGYRDASLQEIAQKAGITAGNIYNYFDHKEELLSTLISPVLKEIKEIFGIRARDLPLLVPRELVDISEKKLDDFIRVYQNHRELFVLLFEKCDSTKFESTKADVIESLASAVIRAKNTFTASPATQEQEILIRAFATAYISGIISILAEKIDEEQKVNALHRFLPFLRSKLIENLR